MIWMMICFRREVIPILLSPAIVHRLLLFVGRSVDEAVAQLSGQGEDKAVDDAMTAMSG